MALALESGRTEKPRLRGVLHAIAIVPAIAVTVAFALDQSDQSPRTVSLVIYGLSLIALFAGSAALHLGAWPEHQFRALLTLDHANIFITIAGAYTPFVVTLLPDPWRSGLLLTTWSIAGIGIALTPSLLRRSRWLQITLYVGQGWVGVITLPIFLTVLPTPALLLLLTAGLLFTVGATIYARRAPDPFPRFFGYHELFHLFVVLGKIAIVAVVWTWLRPI